MEAQNVLDVQQKFCDFMRVQAHVWNTFKWKRLELHFRNNNALILQKKQGNYIKEYRVRDRKLDKFSQRRKL